LQPIATIVDQAYFPAIIGNCLVIVACLVLGPRLRWLCRLALLINGTSLAFGAVVLFWLASPINSESGMALYYAFFLAAPFLLAILALLAVYRWRMHPSQQNKSLPPNAPAETTNSSHHRGSQTPL
jgi:hypothetical protein